MRIFFRYHIPRAFIKPTQNLLVVLEEEEANPEKIDILIVNRDTVCSIITEHHPPNVKSWERKDSHIRPVVVDVKPKAHLKCPNNRDIVSVEFASYGDPYGTCGSFVTGKCHAAITKEIVEQVKYCYQHITLSHTHTHTQKKKKSCSVSLVTNRDASYVVLALAALLREN